MPSTFDYARAVATVGAASGFGYERRAVMLNTSLTMMPALFAAKGLDARARLSSIMFDTALGTVVPIVISASVASGIAAYLAPHRETLLGLSQQSLFIAAGLCSFFPAPYTNFVLLPTINRLKSIEAGKSQGDVDALLKKWTAGHNVRTVVFFIASVLSISTWLLSPQNMASIAQRLAAGLKSQNADAGTSSKQRNPLRAGLLASSSLAQFDDAPIERVEVDGTALLKISRGGSGHLLGIDERGVLLVSDAFALPNGSVFPAPERLNADERDREASYRRKDDSFDAAFSNAYTHASTYLPRIAELGADANVVGIFTTSTAAATTSTTTPSGAPSGALVEALVRYQLGGSVESASSAAKSKISRAPRFPGQGVALVIDAASTQAAVGGLSLKAYRISDEYIEAVKSGHLDAQSFVGMIVARTDARSLAQHGVTPTNILRELPVTITSTSLLAGALATYAAPSETANVPTIAPSSLKTLSIPATSLTAPLQNLLTSVEASANVLGNMRFSRKPGGKDALRSLAAADAASKSLNTASSVALLRAYGARASVDASA